MSLDSSNSVVDGLTVTASDDWRYLGSPVNGQNSRLWSLSGDVRNAFGENVVESWGSTAENAPLDHVAQEFRRSSTSIPQWEELFATTWQEGPATYQVVSGTAVVAGEEIKSSSVIALTTSDGEISARQVVVTTFVDNQERHRGALRAVTADTITLESIIDG